MERVPNHVVILVEAEAQKGWDKVEEMEASQGITFFNLLGRATTSLTTIPPSHL